ncbi:hypothetical protein JG688_00010681, partial [Phytophthora aleatoria]
LAIHSLSTRIHLPLDWGIYRSRDLYSPVLRVYSSCLTVMLYYYKAENGTPSPARFSRPEMLKMAHILQGLLDQNKIRSHLTLNLQLLATGKRHDCISSDK